MAEMVVSRKMHTHTHTLKVRGTCVRVKVLVSYFSVHLFVLVKICNTSPSLLDSLPSSPLFRLADTKPPPLTTTRKSQPAMSTTSSSGPAKPIFWKPGTAPPSTGSTLDRASESTSFLPPPIPPSSSSSSELPIFTHRLSILHTLESHQVIILIAPTGSGKSTLLPQLLLSSSWSTPTNGIIGVTQPRRLAAISLASHLSASLGTPLGQEVGYSIRFEENSSPQTKIKYVTDGTLFKELVRDPLLTRYSVIVVDEAHERSVWSDLLLGVLKKVLRRRRELRIVVASATVDAGMFKDFFEDLSTDGTGREHEGGVKVIQLDTSKYPIHIAYLKNPCQDYLQETIGTIRDIHLTEPQGDILAFLTGREEIEYAIQALSDMQLDLPPSAAKMHLLPLHSGLSAAEQSAIFDPAPNSSLRKVILATNIAETSITLPTITYIVDCGFVKLRTTSSSGIESLQTFPISRASALQRTGRAGRTHSGKCFRLYTEQYFLTQMRDITPPELTRVGLEGVVLMLKCLGVDNLVRFDWVPPSPPPELLARALERLVELGALDEYVRLTERGSWMGELPLPPHLGRILIASAEEANGCCKEILSILAMTQITHPFYSPQSPETQLSIRNFTAQQGDLFTLLNIFISFTDENVGRKSANWCKKQRLNFKALSRALSIRIQLDKFLIRFASLPTSGSNVKLYPKSSVMGRVDAVEKITKTLATGLYTNLAQYDETKMCFRTVVGDKQVWPHPNSGFFNQRPEEGKKWVLYGEAISSTQGAEQGEGGEGKIWIRDIIVLDDLEWVTKAVPGVYNIKTRFGRQGGSSTLPINGSSHEFESEM